MREGPLPDRGWQPRGEGRQGEKQGRGRGSWGPALPPTPGPGGSLIEHLQLSLFRVAPRLRVGRLSLSLSAGECLPCSREAGELCHLGVPGGPQPGLLARPCRGSNMQPGLTPNPAPLGEPARRAVQHGSGHVALVRSGWADEEWYLLPELPGERSSWDPSPAPTPRARATPVLRAAGAAKASQYQGPPGPGLGHRTPLPRSGGSAAP